MRLYESALVAVKAQAAAAGAQSHATARLKTVEKNAFIAFQTDSWVFRLG
jgi:hypothetical protein